MVSRKTSMPIAGKVLISIVPRDPSSTEMRAISLPAVFIASIPIAFADPQAAKLFWLVIVVVRVLLRRHYGSIYSA